MSSWIIAAAIVVAVFVISRFVPFLRGIISILIRLVIFVGATFATIAGIAMLENNETIFDSPGWRPRFHRFVNVDNAATSDKGLGSAECPISKHLAETAASPPAQPEHRHARRHEKAPADEPAPAATATPAPEGGNPEEADEYPELVTRGYPGIPRATLFDMARDTVNGLAGWKIVNANPGSGMINAVFTSRVLGMQDKVDILVTARSDIEICSQSEIGMPDSTSMLRFFRGDFGANIGHIKQFYTAMKPLADAFYKKQEEKEEQQQNRNR